VRQFVAACPPMTALVHALSLAQFERSVRDLLSATSDHVGHVDLFSAVYLPYGEVFVTRQKQESLR
jgi:hypothetical protein